MWNKCKLILVATDEKSNIFKRVSNYKGEFYEKPVLEFTDNQTLIDNLHLTNSGNASTNALNKTRFFNLIIVSQDTINDNDYFMSAFYSYPLQNTKEWRDKQESMIGSNNVSDLKFHKIISATGKSLTIRYDKRFKDVTINNNFLPQIPQSFIEQYIIEYNKDNICHISNVLVEYEDNLNDVHRLEDFEFLKINSDNTINIKTVKDSFSRVELIEFIKKSLKECDSYNSILQEMCGINELAEEHFQKRTNKFIEENF